MICYNCGSKLQSGAPENCIVCGAKFKGTCQSCNSPLPFYANFCPNCGLYITKSKESESFDELKKVAVIFADVTGFTRLSERFAPDEVKALINEFFEYILKPVHLLNGLIDKFIGDCVMILFGAKTSHPDDPLRAVQCALEMIKLCREFSKLKDIELSLSIGINYGLVAIGRIGGYFEKDYTVIGDVVNTAQRLQSIAPANTIYVSENVYKETFENVDYSGPIEVFVKNKTNPVKCYIPKSIISRPANYSVFEKILTKHVNFILDLIVNKEKNCVVIVGEEGVGKSYIIRNVILRLENNGIKTYSMSIPSLQYIRPYYLISLIISKILNINLEDSPSIKRNRLISFLDYLFKENFELKAKSLNFISLIFQLELDPDFKNILSYMSVEDIEFELFHTLFSFFDKIFELEFPVFIIENISNSDKESLKFIDYLISREIRDKAFFIFSTEKDLFEISQYKKLKIDKLTKSDIEDILTSYFNIEKPEKSIVDFIFNVSEGKLSYILEILQWLEYNQFTMTSNNLLNIEKISWKIDEFIEKIILHKLLKLNNEMIEFLKIAAVYGQQFSFRTIVEILKPTTSETEIITALVKANIIRLVDIVYRTSKLDRVYEFTNLKIIKVLLDLIPDKNKKTIHLYIAKTIEKIFKDNLTSYYDLLFYHYNLSGDNQKAAEYLFEQAMLYKKLSLYKHSAECLYKILNLDNFDNLKTEFRITALKELISIEKMLGNYDNVIELSEKLKNYLTLEDEKILLDCDICECYILQNNFDKAIQILQELQNKYNINPSVEYKTLYLECLYKSYTGSSELVSIVKRLESLLKVRNEYENLAEILNIVAFSLYNFSADSQKALSYLNKALNYANKTKNLLLKTKLLINLGIIKYQSGKLLDSIKHFNHALENAKVISNRHMQLILLNNLGIVNLEKGFLKSAADYFSQAYNLSHEWNLSYEECITMINIGELYLEKGAFTESYNFFAKAFDMAAERGFFPEKALALIDMAKVLIAKNNIKGAEEFLNNAWQILSEYNELNVLFEYYFTKSQLFTLCGDLQNALICIEKAADIANQLKNTIYQLKTLRKQGSILAAFKIFEKAIDFFNKSISLASNIGSSLELSKCYLEIAKIFYEKKEKELFESNLKLALSWAAKIDDDCTVKKEIEELYNANKSQL